MELNSMNSVTHFILGFVVRLILIFYSEVQDSLSEVQFTDIDYKVFTDGARNIIEGKSVYERNTYRYSPLVALLLIPNVVLHRTFGKVVFSICDVIVTALIQKILHLDGFSRSDCISYSLVWLYNPLSIIISTRGNMDSVGAVLVLYTLLLFRRKKYVYAGILHGLSIHFRLYPVIFSLPMYICIKNEHKSKFKKIFYPDKNRIFLTLSCISTLILITYICFSIYGFDFLNESVLYHIKRKDIRHNYSVYFYLQYLTVNGPQYLSKLFFMLPQLSLLILFTVLYNSCEQLAFSQFCLTFVLVSFNSVLTCQYFIWYLCLLPISIPYIVSCSKESVTVCGLWILSQLAWLYPAYMLEFNSSNTFFNIWIHGLIFFCSNMLLLSVILKNYNLNLKKIKMS